MPLELVLHEVLIATTHGASVLHTADNQPMALQHRHLPPTPTTCASTSSLLPQTPCSLLRVHTQAADAATRAAW